MYNDTVKECFITKSHIIMIITMPNSEVKHCLHQLPQTNHADMYLETFFFFQFCRLPLGLLKISVRLPKSKIFFTYGLSQMKTCLYLYKESFTVRLLTVTVGEIQLIKYKLKNGLTKIL